MISKPKTRFMAASFKSDATSASPPLSRSVAAMFRSTWTKITRSATGVQYDDVGFSQPVRQAEFLAQHHVHAGHLILDDFGRGVPERLVPCATSGS